MSLPSRTDVLIVGAGPAGLTCAASLAELGVQPIVVDQSAANKYGSRAAGVHARTLEVLENIKLAKPIIDSGLQCSTMALRGGTNKLFEFDFFQLRDETRYPMVLLTPQHEVERILCDRLTLRGINVLREKTVVGLKEATSQPGVDVTFDDGAVVCARYIVGADGVRSTVRLLSGIDFKDPQSGVSYEADIGPTMQFALADIYIREPLPPLIPRDSPLSHLDKFLILLPLKSSADPHEHPRNASLWRMAIGFMDGESTLPQKPSREFLQNILDERNPWGSQMIIDSVATSSRYRIRSAVASTFFKKFGDGNILLVGDAAHSHSPAGGQGMNLGICDAFALSHAIHAHMVTHRKESLEKDLDKCLHSYASSRKKIAIQVISMTKGLNMLVGANTGWRRVIRNLVLGVVGALPFVRRIIVRRVSGLVYRDV